jgi:hypothetical protein
MPSPSASTSNLPSESAAEADSFVDSAGVNTHWNYGQSAYRASYGAISSALVASGIRHIRDGGLNYSVNHDLSALESSGVRHSAGFPINVTAQEIVATILTYGSNVDFVEPQNEYDETASSDPHWASKIVAEQKLLYATVRSNPAFSSIRVLGPSLAHPADAAAVGSLDAYEDAGNEHDYTCNLNPGTTASSGIENVTALLRKSTSSKPIWTTEVGYADNSSGWSCALSDETIAKYAPRTLAERWLAGEPRTYFYQFADMSPGTDYNSMGFVTQTGAPKPQYYAIKSLLALLADPGMPFTASRLHFTLNGNLTNLHHILLQKRDGAYYLMYWLEVPGWDSATSTPINVPSQTFRLNLSTTPSLETKYVYDRNWNLDGSVVTPTQSQSLTATDAISVVRLKF